MNTIEKKQVKLTISKFNKQFPTEDSCRNHLVNIRWGGNPKCPNIHCQNNQNNYFLKTRNIFKCRCCKKQFSATQGTLFENSKMPLQDWFLLLFMFACDKRGISSIYVATTILGVQQKTAWLMLKKIREALSDENEDVLLHGIVQCDEAYIGGNPRRNRRLGYKLYEHKVIKKSKEPYGHKETYVGMIEVGGRVVIKSLGAVGGKFGNKQIIPLLKKYIHHNSYLMTDGATCYKWCKKYFRHHIKVVHSNNEYVKGQVTTNNIENVWLNLKAECRGTYKHFSSKKAQAYADEFTFRFNRRDMSNAQKFSDLLMKAIFFKDNPYGVIESHYGVNNINRMSDAVLVTGNHFAYTVPKGIFKLEQHHGFKRVA